MSGNSNPKTKLKTQLEWDEFFSGWGAGVINVSITFPLHKLMFRQMLYGISTTEAFRQLRKEGIYVLYRGLLPPVCQKSIAVSIMFGSYNYYSTLILKNFPGLNAQVAKSCGAYFAGVSEAILAPFERLQTILSDRRYNKEFPNSAQAVRHIWRNHGFLEFYRGGSTIIFRNSLSNVIFFASREHAQTLLPTPEKMWTKYVADFVSGGLIGALISSAFYPLNVVKTRMQRTLGGDFQSSRHVFNIVFDERNRKWSKMFTGVHLNLTRALLSWGIINASYELIKTLIARQRDRES